MIKNHKNVFIRLNNEGQAVSCLENEKGKFEYHKAKNILDSLPKTLKRMNFKVLAIPDITPKKENAKTEQKVIQKEYKLSENITRWIEKFGICDDIFKEAEERKKRTKY